MAQPMYDTLHGVGGNAMGSFLQGCRRGSKYFLIAAVWVCGVAVQADAASVTLQWDPNAEPDLTGYKVHYGLVSRTYTTHLDVGNVVSRVVDGLAASTKYFFAVTASDSVGNESGYSNEVTMTTPAAGVETISTPLRPAGPVTGVVGVAYTYTASGAVSSTGDAVQYRFSWSDGTASAWLAAGVTSAAKTWSAPGSYTLVSVEARCSLHPTVVSQVSPALAVTIAAAPLETISAPLAPSGPRIGLVGTAYTYTTGGAISSTGDPVQYRFSWSDGSVSEWLPAAAASATKTWNAPGTYSLVRAEARCGLHQSIVSSTSPALTVIIAAGTPETISAASAPRGATGGDVSVRYAFSAGGAASSAGHALRYRFHWGDGTVSNWLEPGQPVLAAQSWSVPGTYLVRTEAACATHPTVGSLSSAVSLSIAKGIASMPVGCVMLNAPGADLDFDGDGRDDVGCYAPAGGNWYINRSTEGLWQPQFGYAGTIPVTGDFDGDGRSDIGVYYPPGGNWYILKSSEGFWQTTFGFSGTIPVVGDFDGDGRDDFGCYYPPGGNWYLFMSQRGFWQTTFGYAGTEPIVGDFDRDGKSDFGCYYPPGGNWYVFKSTEGFWQTQFGYVGTKPVVGDFDGDGRSDFGCYHPSSGNWYVLKSSEGFQQTLFGYAGTDQVVGDFDGDGKSDFGVYSPQSGAWQTLTSAMSP